MPRSELAKDSYRSLGKLLFFPFYPDNERFMAITEQNVNASEALFWTAPDGFQFPILINLTEGNDGTWQL